MRDPAELHRWVFNYNMDDGLAPLWPIIDSHETEFATALLIYWMCNGPWSEMNPAGQEHPIDVELAALARCVRARLLNGHYARGRVRLDPRRDFNLTRTQIYKLTKAGIPKELLEPDYREFSPTHVIAECPGGLVAWVRARLPGRGPEFGEGGLVHEPRPSWIDAPRDAADVRWFERADLATMTGAGRLLGRWLIDAREVSVYPFEFGTFEPAETGSRVTPAKALLVDFALCPDDGTGFIACVNWSGREVAGRYALDNWPTGGIGEALDPLTFRMTNRKPGEDSPPAGWEAHDAWFAQDGSDFAPSARPTPRQWRRAQYLLEAYFPADRNISSANSADAMAQFSKNEAPALVEETYFALEALAGKLSEDELEQFLQTTDCGYAATEHGGAIKTWLRNLAHLLEY